VRNPPETPWYISLREIVEESNRAVENAKSKIKQFFMTMEL